MKTQKNQRKLSKKLIITSIVLGAAILVTIGYLLVSAGTFTGKSENQTSAPSPINTVDYEEPTDSQKEAGDTTKTETINETTPTTPSAANKVTITALQQTEDSLQIRSYVDTLSSTGNCKLTLSNASKTIEKNTPIQASADVSTCQGFDIPLAELSTGNWSVQIQYIIGNSTSTATSTIEIK